MMTHNYICSALEQADLLIVNRSQIAVMSRGSPEKETENEDCAAVMPINKDTMLLMVADGVGGHINGAIASSLLTKLMDSTFKREKTQITSVREMILTSIEETNFTLMRKETGEATTVAIAEVNRNSIRSYHVGDSEILVTGQRGKIKLQTLPHSPVGYAMESGLLNEEEAIMHSDRHYVSNTVGQDDMHITIGSPVILSKRDTVLLGTDGLFDNLLKEEIIEIVRKGPLKKCAELLIETVLERMSEHDGKRPSKPDDVTFILYRPPAS